MPCMMLLGENSAGKSSVLEGVALAIVGSRVAAGTGVEASDLVRRDDNTGRNVIDLVAKDPLLIDPTVRDPARHLRWLLDGELSLVAPTVHEDGPDPYGATSNRGYALNRAGLVAERTGALRELRYHREQIMEALDSHSGGVVPPAALKAAQVRAAALRRYQEPGRDFTALASAFVDALEAELEALQATGDA